MAEISKEMDKAAAKGRGADSLVGHLTPGDLIIPKELHTPEMLQAIHKHFSANGTTVGRYMAGHHENSINPETGKPEFGFFKKIAHAVLPHLGFVGGTADGLIQGNSIGSSLKEGLGSGLEAAGTIIGGEVGLPFAQTIGSAAGAAASGAIQGQKGSDLWGNIAGAAIAPNIGDAIGSVSSLGSPSNIDLPWTDINEAGISPSLASAAGSGAGSSFSAPLSENVGSGTVGSQGFSAAENQLLSNASNSVGSAATSAAPASTSLDAFMKNPGAGSAWDMVKANPSTALNAAGMALSAARSNQAMPGENALKSQAAQLSGQGQQLSQYLENGTLPAGLQQSITQATESAKAQVRSRFASMGMSGSSAEQQELAQIDSRAQAQGSEMALNLLKTGIDETGLSSKLYESILNNSMAKEKDLESAIAGFAGSFAGGGINHNAAMGGNG